MIFSASRIDTWIRCNRLAGWEYICGYRPPQAKGSGADIGDQVHKELERLKTTGDFPDRMAYIGRLAAEALPHVRDLSLETGASIEGDFHFRGRHQWTGRIDLRAPGIVVDYKTTSDRKWIKSPADLQSDVQAQLYAEYEHRRGVYENGVELRWVYVVKNGCTSEVTVLYVSREQAARSFEAIESYADEMQAAADAAPEEPAARHLYVLNELEPNYNRCDDYGGCPHKARCNVPFFRSLEPKEKHMGLLERLSQQNAFNGPANEEQPTVPPPAALPAMPPPTAGNPWLPIPTAAPPVLEGVTFSKEFLAQPETAAPGQINPPKRRGRPRKNETPVPDSTEAEAVAVPDSTEAAPAVVAPPVPEKHRIGTLYVGCLPRGVETSDFDVFVAKAKVAIGPADWRSFEYGKGNGLLLDMFQAVVQYDRPTTMTVIDPRAPEAILCLSYLRSVSDQIVEAMR